MILGLLMLLVPPTIYLFTLPFSGRLAKPLRWAYRVLGGGIAIVGSSVSYYFAAYSGDQGGIAAFYFQLVVMFGYVSFSSIIAIVHLINRAKPGQK